MSTETPNGVEGVTLREYIELLIDAKTTEIKVIAQERITAVSLAYERHDGEHKVIDAEMEHLNQLRQEVTADRGLLVSNKIFDTYKETVGDWMKLMGNNYAGLRGQMIGASAVITILFIVVQIAIGVWANTR